MASPTDPTSGDLLRLHIDVLVEMANSPRTGSDVVDALKKNRDDPPSRSRVYQVINELDDAGLIAEVRDGEYHNATVYEATETGVVRARERVAHLGSRLFE